jgi:hypothetical protein
VKNPAGFLSLPFNVSGRLQADDRSLLYSACHLVAVRSTPKIDPSLHPAVPMHILAVPLPFFTS